MHPSSPDNLGNLDAPPISNYALPPDFLTSPSATSPSPLTKPTPTSPTSPSPTSPASSYSSYASYHPDDLAELNGPYKDYILTKSVPPTVMLAAMNKVFAAAGLRPLERSELPSFPLDKDALVGWELKWVRNHEFLRPMLRDWVSLDSTLLDERPLQLAIRAMHVKLVVLARETTKVEQQAPEGHAVTLNYYQDPATSEPLSTPANATSYLAILIALKNAHRELLNSPEYKSRYLACRGVICHCCGTPNEAAKSWPMEGTKMLNYHVGAGNSPCRHCRHAIDTALAGTGTYHVLPEAYRAQIDSINAGTTAAGLTAAGLSDTKQLLVARLVRDGREAAHLGAKGQVDTVEDVGSALAILAALKQKP